MSAVHNHLAENPNGPGAPNLAETGSPDLDQGWTLHARQIGDQLLRAVEVQRLPEALAIRAQVLNGESITEADRESLEQMIRTVDRASNLLAGEQDLAAAVRGVAALRDEILARARANELAAAAVDSMMRTKSHPKDTVATC